jgi:hypothetical protein
MVLLNGELLARPPRRWSQLASWAAQGGVLPLQWLALRSWRRVSSAADPMNGYVATVSDASG